MFVTLPWARRSSTAEALATAYDAVADGKPDAAYSIMRRLAEEGVAEAQHFVGWCYQQGVCVERSEDQAFHWWLKAADQAFGESQFGVAYSYEHGCGVETDLKKAYVYYRLAEISGVDDGSEGAKRLRTKLSALDLDAAERTVQQSVSPDDLGAGLSGQGRG